MNICGVVLRYEALFSDNNGIEFAVTCAENCKKYRTGNLCGEEGGGVEWSGVEGEGQK